ncbi:MAG: response regulator transcription factor [Actinomycetota bacterium]
MSAAPAHIVVVEDDQSVREMLAAVLTSAGHRVDAYGEGEQAVMHDASLVADLAILDVGLPGMDGLEVCRRLRRHGRIAPVLMLTARHEVGDRVDGLDAGADDYLVKPFALDELLARVRALLRRGAPPDGAGPGALELDDLLIDPVTREAVRSGHRLELTRLEFDLLRLLVDRSPAVLTREFLHQEIWGYDEHLMSNSLEVFVSQLRRKTERHGGERIVHTVRGVGYTARVAAAVP